MAKKSGSPQRQRTWIITLTTVAVMAAGFAYYFLGYVKVKEASLNERGFRILSLLGANISSKASNEMRSAVNQIRAEVDGVELFDWGWVPDNNFAHYEIRDSVVFSGYPSIASLEGAIVVTDTVRRRKWRITIDIEGMADSLLRRDLFSHFLLLKDRTLLYTTLRSGFLVNSADSVLTNDLGFQVSTIKEIDIGGVIYKVFLQPYQFNNERWLIGGLMESTKYRSLSMRVSPTIIMLIFLATALSLISIPFLKLLVMSPMERLNISDLIFSALAMIGGSSIVIVILLHVYRSNLDGDQKSQRLQSFTSKVSTDFVGELRTAYQQLEDFDSLLQFTAGKEIDCARKYPLLRQIFWMDNDGRQIFKWTATKDTSILNRDNQLISVGGRDYFRNNLNNKAWKLDSMVFSFQSIYSWTIGQSMLVVSKLSEQTPDTIKVIGMSSFFYSTIDAMVPLGYSYAILDEKGNVLLHSDKSRNLQENFIVETEHDPNLRSAIYSRTGAFLDLPYLGKRYNGYIKPVKSLPLFVVGLEDQEYGRTLRAQTLNFTLLHTFLFFLFFVGMALLSRVLRFPKSRLKKTRLLYGWIWPLEKNLWSYLSIIAVNTIIVVLLVFFSQIRSDEEGIAMLYSASVFCFLFTFTILNREYGENRLAGNISFNLALGFIILSILVYVFIHGFWWVLLFQGLMVLGYLTITTVLKSFQNRWDDSRKETLRSKFRYRSVYSVMLLSWLFIISVVPSILFYQVSYNLEDEVSTKHQQLHMARLLAEKSPVWSNRVRQDFFLAKLGTGSPNADTVEMAGQEFGTLTRMSSGNLILSGRGDIHADHLFSSIKLSPRLPKPNEANKQSVRYPFNKWVSSMVRPFYNKIVIENNNLVFDMSLDSAQWWHRSSNDTITLFYKNYLFPKDQGEGVVLKSLLNPFYLPLLGHDRSVPAVIFWLAFIFIFLIGLYYLIGFSVRSIFVQLPLSSTFSEIDKKLFQGSGSRKNVFVVGLPHSGKTEFLNGMYPPNDPKLYTINLIEVFYADGWNAAIKKAMDPNIKVVLVNYFEYNLGDIELATKKLQLLEQLMLQPDKKIIVSTSIHLTNIEELYSSDGVISETDEQAIYRWTELFKNFYEVYYPLQGIEDQKRAGETNYENSRLSPLINELISEEFSHGGYLGELRSEIIRLVEWNLDHKRENDHDQIILKVQSLSAVYYHSLWSTCTENEKYVIYDLAEDGLVNAKNVQTLEVLMNKGLIVYKDVLRIMNESFRNFVLTKIGPNDALRFERKVRSEGNWSSFRNPIIVILLAVGTFLLVTQQDSLNSFVSFLTPFIAIVPALIRISMLIATKRDRGGDDD